MHTQLFEGVCVVSSATFLLENKKRKDGIINSLSIRDQYGLGYKNLYNAMSEKLVSIKTGFCNTNYFCSHAPEALQKNLFSLLILIQPL